jgi:hypothetical protein
MLAEGLAQAPVLADNRDMTVDDLRGEVERLVLERQQLRLRGASAAQLEQNRLRLVAAQQQLSLALIETHLRAA